MDTEQLVKNSTEIQVYPNPNTNQFNIKSDELISGFEIYNLFGQLIQFIELTPAKQVQFTHQLVAGTYFIRIKTENQQKAIRLQVY